MKNNFVKRFNIISFDIFDTLILRNVNNPHRIFDIVEKEYNFPDKIENFSNVRIQSEIKAYKKWGIPTLDEIYQVMCEEYPMETVEKYKKEEIKWELLSCMSNPKVKKLYEECVKIGKRIIIISDMYLPRVIIEKMLLKCGFYNYEKLFISSEVKLSKHSGELFEYVIKELDVSANDIFHIGDNIRNDYINPKLKKIQSSLVPGIKKTKSYKSIEEEILDNFLKNKKIKENFMGIGYKLFGPLLYGYTNWLHEMFKKECIEYVLFFSRDGYLMQKAYNFLYDEEAVPNSYFYASRRLFLVAALWMSPDLTDVIKMMYLPRYFTINHFINSLGLDEEKLQNEIENLNVNLYQEYDKNQILKSHDFIEFYNHIKTQIIQNSKKEYEGLLIKLRSLDIMHKNLAVVDIGWIGNMQKCFEMIIQKAGLPINITGYYLGVDPSSENQKICKMRGYLYQKNKNEKLYYKGRFIEPIYELFFMAPHGSALYYEIKNKKALPVCKNFEYHKTETYKSFLKIQKGAFAFIDDYSEIGNKLKNNEMIYGQYVLKNFLRPKLYFANIFGEMEVYTEKWSNLAKPKKNIEMILRPKQRYKEFILSSWKPGYLKRLFKFPFPYEKILGKLFEIMS